MNIQFAKKTIQSLVSQGVDCFCLCAGARNAPFVEVLSKAKGIKVYSFFDERAASFFALGRIQNSGHPVAVVTTSGTAVAELLPATVEAFYSGLPLVLVTADRPRSYRGSGAPQAVLQNGMLGPYAINAYDWDAEEDGEKLESFQISQVEPTHLNICFDEPLIDDPVEEIHFQPLHVSDSLSLWDTQEEVHNQVLNFLEAHKTLLVILGELPKSKKIEVEDFLLQIKQPIYAEALSGLREREALKPYLIKAGEGFLRTEGLLNKIDGVLRIGGVPTLRFWRDLEKSLYHMDVLSISHRPFSGLSREHNSPLSLGSFLNWWSESKNSFLGSNKTHDIWSFSDSQLESDSTTKSLCQVLKDEPHSEPGMICKFSELIPEDSQIFLGNSLPIREWDLVATTKNKNFRITSNRGANGIDGLVSGFLGFSSGDCENWAFIGDLSALYDLSGLWITKQLDIAKLRLVIINNGGGKIFSRIFKNPLFENQHHIKFQAWAEMFGWDYLCIDKVPENLSLPNGPVLIELQPNEESSSRFWNKYEDLWKK